MSLVRYAKRWLNNESRRAGRGRHFNDRAAGFQPTLLSSREFIWKYFYVQV